MAAKETAAIREEYVKTIWAAIDPGAITTPFWHMPLFRSADRDREFIHETSAFHWSMNVNWSWWEPKPDYSANPNWGKF